MRMQLLITRIKNLGLFVAKNKYLWYQTASDRWEQTCPRQLLSGINKEAELTLVLKLNTGEEIKKH